MRLYMITIACISQLYSFEYRPKGAVRIPPSNCVWRIEGAKGLYSVPNIGFMVKFGINRWRKVLLIDQVNLDSADAVLEGFLQMDGIFMIHRAQGGKLALTTYWPNYHIRLFAARFISSMMGGDDEKSIEVESK
jgi:hypothetical protein